MQRIREIDPTATALLPSVVSTSRYLDDILFIFPLHPTGPDSLKISKGGPYSDTLGIKMECHAEKVPFLDPYIS